MLARESLELAKSAAKSRPCLVEMATASTSASINAEGVEALHTMVKLLQSIKKTSEMSATKLDFIEKRQCYSGEGTDSSRFIDMWSRSESAHVSSAQVLEMAHRILENKTAEVTRYSELFAEKDARRIESLVAFFYITFIEKDESMWNYHEPNYGELGRLAQYMPSFKKKMRVAARLLRAEFGERYDVHMPTTAFRNHRKLKIPHRGHLRGRCPLWCIFGFLWFQRAVVGM